MKPNAMHYEDAKAEDVPKLLALLVHEVQGLRRDLNRASARPEKGRLR